MNVRDLVVNTHHTPTRLSAAKVQQPVEVARIPLDIGKESTDAFPWQ